MLRCSEVTRLCASEELDRSPLLTKAAVRIHLLLCRQCRRYVRDLEEIGSALRGLWRESTGTEERHDAIIRSCLTDPDSPRA